MTLLVIKLGEEPSNTTDVDVQSRARVTTLLKQGNMYLRPHQQQHQIDFETASTFVICARLNKLTAGADGVSKNDLLIANKIYEEVASQDPEN